MKTPRWIPESANRAIHDELLAEHGGAAGVTKAAELESALARPRNLFAYEQPELPELAASYAFGLIKNHCFADGNKRTALAAVDVFLTINGHEFTAEETDAVAMIVGVADGTVSEPELAEWIGQHTRRSSKRRR